MGALRFVFRLLSRALLAVLALIVIAVVGFGIWDVSTYDARAWRADYEHLKREMAQNYANLDWVVEHRGLDLAALDAETSAAIDNAHSRVRAMFALHRFIKAFNDPHLRFKRREPAAPTTEASESNEASEAAEPMVASCAADGYEAEDVAFERPFKNLEGWRALRAAPFPTGVAGDLGVLRIAAFGEDRYPEACEAVLRAGMTARELQLATRARLQEELRAAIDELKQQGATRLIVDVSGNGGGTEWVSEVIQMMTDRDMQRASARMVAPACDRSGIWRGESVCPVLAPAEEPARLTGTGEWTGPLFILADRGTGSASEDFVAWLQQNGVATVIGQRTAGAGCGYVGGGGRIRLSAVPLDVMAPNCARLLNNGVNEIEGIAPDVELAMDTPAAEWAPALTRALAARAN
jgi:hypothetical protein